MTLTEAIADIYRQVDAPEWAAPNLDALADVLRDLSWLPAGPIALDVPQLAGPDDARLRGVLWQVAEETGNGPRPILPCE